MTPRRRKRELTPKEQIARDKVVAKEKEQDRKIRRQKNYAVKQKKAFYKEYRVLCKKYGCFIQSFSGSYVNKFWPKEKIYTLKSHLEGVCRRMDDSDRPVFYDE